MVMPMERQGCLGRSRTVVLADDHAVVRSGIAALLATDPIFRVVAETADLPETQAVVRRLHPDLLVVDLNLHGTSSLPQFPALLTSSPATRLLVLTMLEDPLFAREALRAGAHGYLLKEAAGEELVAAMRLVVSGGTYLHPSLGARLVAGLATAVPELTEREREVLALIAEGHTNAQTARRLHLSLRTVEAHRASIKTKLGTGARDELYAVARERGLLV
jgi:two-component system response regulator NreC